MGSLHGGFPFHGARAPASSVGSPTVPTPEPPSTGHVLSPVPKAAELPWLQTPPFPGPPEPWDTLCRMGHV